MLQCSGTAPCTRYAKGNIACDFKGRAHQRLLQDFLSAEHQLRATQDNLATSQQNLLSLCYHSSGPGSGVTFGILQEDLSSEYLRTVPRDSVLFQEPSL
jgi:hypothetical protein